jgi:hypothetical protein
MNTVQTERMLALVHEAVQHPETFTLDIYQKFGM